MTTSVKIQVNGPYRATVTQDDLDPVIVLGPTGEQTFWLRGGHPTRGNFKVVEEYVAEVAADPLGR